MSISIYVCDSCLCMCMLLKSVYILLKSSTGICQNECLYAMEYVVTQ